MATKRTESPGQKSPQLSLAFDSGSPAPRVASLRTDETLARRLHTLRGQVGERAFAVKLAEAKERETLVLRAIELRNANHTWAQVCAALPTPVAEDTLRRWLARYERYGVWALVTLAGKTSVGVPDELRAARPPQHTRGPKRVSFLRWMGGKSAIAAWICAQFPKFAGTYYEPMVGAGSVFLTLAPPRAVLGDANAELMVAWKCLGDSPDTLFDRLGAMRVSREEYHRIRDLSPTEMEELDAAARFIYLNQTGFNGLYRVNKRGVFNVPYGGARDLVLDRAHYLQVSERLRGATLLTGDVETTCADAGEGDLVYLDPPYMRAATVEYAAVRYHADGFDNARQVRLAAFARELAARGARVFLSHAEHPVARDLYAGWRVHQVDARVLAKGGRPGQQRVELLFESP